jgi:hypothetical protein
MIESMNTGTDSTGAPIGGLPERRGTGRFPVREDVRYRIVQSRTAIVSGVGATLNIGSGGILFTTEEKLPVGSMVELSVNWPARLDGICPLQFVATGRVVRSDALRAAVRIERYEFKTRSMNSVAAAGGGVGVAPTLVTHPGERCL